MPVCGKQAGDVTGTRPSQQRPLLPPPTRHQPPLPSPEHQHRHQCSGTTVAGTTGSTGAVPRRLSPAAPIRSPLTSRRCHRRQTVVPSKLAPVRLPASLSPGPVAVILPPLPNTTLFCPVTTNTTACCREYTSAPNSAHNHFQRLPVLFTLQTNLKRTLYHNI